MLNCQIFPHCASLLLGVFHSCQLHDDFCELFVSDSNEEPKNQIYTGKAELRKNTWKRKNGPGRNHCSGGRVEKSKGFLPNSFDQVLLDAPCSALGLRPRLFAGEVR